VAEAQVEKLPHRLASILAKRTHHRDHAIIKTPLADDKTREVEALETENPT
jgi:hypothetical protein